MTENRMRNASEREQRLLREHPLTIVSEEVMSKAADTSTPQGILCVAGMPVYSREALLGRRQVRDTETDLPEEKGMRLTGKMNLFCSSWKIFRIPAIWGRSSGLPRRPVQPES